MQKTLQFVRIKRQAQSGAQGKEVSEMPFGRGWFGVGMGRGFGLGRGFGIGRGMGFGFRGASPPWPYVGRGRGGMPRCWHPGLYAGTGYAPPPPPPYYGGDWGAPYPGMSREDEMGFLKEEANAVKARLDEIEARIKELEKEEK